MVCIGFLSRRTHRDRLALPSLPHLAVLQQHLLVGFALLSVRGLLDRSVGRLGRLVCPTAGGT